MSTLVNKSQLKGIENEMSFVLGLPHIRLLQLAYKKDVATT